MSKSDAAIVARWSVKLRIRQALLAYARRELAYWQRRKIKAVTPWGKRHAEMMLAQREAKVAHREAQVAAARRIIERHRGHRPNAVKGIDVSNHNATVNFDLVRKAGYDFVIAKATEGTGFHDSFFFDNVKKARAAGLKVGAYHFLRHGNPDGQAAVFAARYRSAGLGKGDILPVVDVEAEGVTALDVQAFVSGVTRRLGVRCMIYTFPSFMKWFTTFGCPLWIANFGVKAPTIPAPWVKYAIWQYSSDAAVPGVTGKCDVNVCPNLDAVLA